MHPCISSSLLMGFQLRRSMFVSLKLLLSFLMIPMISSTRCELFRQAKSLPMYFCHTSSTPTGFQPWGSMFMNPKPLVSLLILSQVPMDSSTRRGSHETALTFMITTKAPLQILHITPSTPSRLDGGLPMSPKYLHQLQRNKPSLTSTPIISFTSNTKRKRTNFMMNLQVYHQLLGVRRTIAAKSTKPPNRTG
ncbi:hypothetical protein F5878DRAFT_230723 [Lentinula raphanica]|uniref:Uncharacterized protein n=1 Tax=Lentinula raphanica TaxID=153919 RepID=A0AA38P6R0_9AGAR|nr:hypothetical protein F5878DRAFT_230723 [Lentinula raphanica]